MNANANNILSQAIKLQTKLGDEASLRREVSGVLLPFLHVVCRLSILRLIYLLILSIRCSSYFEMFRSHLFVLWGEQMNAVDLRPARSSGT